MRNDSIWHFAMKNEQNVLLELVKLGIGKSSIYKIPRGSDWQEVFDLAERQRVIAIALDGINRCFEKGIGLDIDLQTKLVWIGAAQQVEVYYQEHEKNLRDLARFYQKHGIKMMVLKGYGLSQNYPVPNHRAPGDIDIYLCGDYEKGDKLLERELGIEIDRSHHHHTVFTFQGESVENHYDFLNVHVRKSNQRMERKLKELAHRTSKDSKITNNNQELENERISFITNTNSTNDTNVILPSTEFNAIYLLRHCAAHFASTHMSIRQVLDWGLFMEKHHKEIEWESYLAYLKQEGMYRFYNLMGLFCMHHFAFDASIFNGLYEDELFERFSNEILTPEFKDKEDGSLIHSLSVKPRRWWHNRWKNRLCYPDGAWSEFAYGLWAKILKPSHFIQ